MIVRSTDVRASLRSRQRGFLLNPFRFGSGGGPTDPNFANVSLLLHMDGTNGSTTFTDNSPRVKIVTAAGNAQISTSQSKFGGASAYFDGSGDYLLVTSDSDFAFGTGDFTIELWSYCTNLGSPRVLFDFRPVSTEGAYPYAYITSTQIVYRLNNADRIAANHGISTNTWVHYAVVRDSGVTKIFVNGTVLGATYTDSSSLLVGASSRPVIAANGLNLGVFAYVGYIDDVRITKGIARYTANFTPPSSAFPNS